MKVAIVGTSQNLTENEERNARLLCSLIMIDEECTLLITGGAKGIDSIAEEVAKDLDIPVCVYEPEGKWWKYYKKRNIKIVRNCDKLFCITTNVHIDKCYHHTPPQEHEKTAGCWTMNEALRLNRPCRLFVINR